MNNKLKKIQERHDRAIAVEKYDFEPRSSVLDDRGELLRMVEELEEQQAAVRDSIPWEWLEMANYKYGKEIFPDPYEQER
jgi:hypothetical protein